MLRSGSLVALLVAGLAAPARAAPPCAADSGAVDALFAELRLDNLTRLRAEFSEEKHIDLLARPLRAQGRLYFDRSLGIARLATAPRPERVVLTTTTLRIEKNGKAEEVDLARSKPLRAFALVFPTLLRGERAPLEAAFELTLCGSAGAGAKDGWELALVPRDAVLREVITKVVVAGHGHEVESLQVLEHSGDRTDTRLAGVVKNDDVPAAELAQAFGAR